MTIVRCLPLADLSELGTEASLESTQAQWRPSRQGMLSQKSSTADCESIWPRGQSEEAAVGHVATPWPAAEASLLGRNFRFGRGRRTVP